MAAIHASPCRLASKSGAKPSTVSYYRHRERLQILEMTSRRLVDFAQSSNLPFEFIPLIQNLDSLKPSMLQLRTGEALVVNCMLQLHGLLEEAPVALESFLGMLYSLNPRVVTLAEREMSNN